MVCAIPQIFLLCAAENGIRRMIHRGTSGTEGLRCTGPTRSIADPHPRAG